MTLHEAIEKLLKQKGGGLSCVVIAEELNKNKWYVKKDGSPIKSNQIGARVKNYPQWFKKENGLIYLANANTKALPKKSVVVTPPKAKTTTTTTKTTPKISLTDLMETKHFKLAGSIDHLVPDLPGLYCIRIKEIEKLNPVFNKHLKQRKHDIIYIGLASKSLKKRFLGQELRAKGHGTFFRSIGAVLGFTPEPGSLIGKKNQKNYTFSSINEQKIISWINQNLLVNWVTINEGLNIIEDSLIKEHLPLLNGAGNPLHLQELKDLRAMCRQIAIEKI